MVEPSYLKKQKNNSNHCRVRWEGYKFIISNSSKRITVWLQTFFRFANQEGMRSHPKSKITGILNDQNTIQNYAKKTPFSGGGFPKLWTCEAVEDCFRIPGKISIRSHPLEIVKNEIIPWKWYIQSDPLEDHSLLPHRIHVWYIYLNLP